MAEDDLNLTPAPGATVDTAPVYPTDGAPAGTPSLDDDFAGSLDDAFRKHTAASKGGDALNGDAPLVDDKPATQDTPVAQDKAPAAAEAQKEQDEFDKVGLPQHARPSTGKQFEEVKAIGRKLVGEERAKYAALQREFEALRIRIPADGGLTPEIKAELEELREITRLTDYQASPEFKSKFTAPIAKATEAVFNALKAVGYDDAAVAKAKEVGVRNLDWNLATKGLNDLEKRKLFRELEKLDDIEASRDEALDKARQDKDEYQKRVASLPDQETLRRDTGVNGAQQILSAHKLFDAIPLDKLPTGISKEHAEALNAGSEEAKKFVQAFSTDVTPQTVGELIAIGAAAQRYLAVNGYLKRHSDGLSTKLAAAEKRAADAETRLTQIRGAGASPSRPAGNPGSGGALIPESDDMDARFREFSQGKNR